MIGFQKRILEEVEVNTTDAESQNFTYTDPENVTESYANDTMTAENGSDEFEDDDIVLDENVTYVVNGTTYDLPEDPQDQDYGEIDGDMEFEGPERILKQECIDSGAGNCDDGY